MGAGLMPKFVELRRHTDSEGDVLSETGVRAALEIGARLTGRYDIVVSTGAQRATQTAACFLAAMTTRVAGGLVVDEGFRSNVEDRWKGAYQAGGGGDLESFRRTDPELVEEESSRLGRVLQRLFETLDEGGRALVVGHSPMNEAAVLGLTGEVVAPLSKGGGVVVEQRDDGSYRVSPC
jgi:broad specificity phosphatase PhoE